MNTYNSMYTSVVYTRKRPWMTVREDQFDNNIFYIVNYILQIHELLQLVTKMKTFISSMISLVMFELHIKHHLFIFTLNAYMHTFFNRALIKHTLVTLLCFSRVCTHIHAHAHKSQTSKYFVHVQSIYCDLICDEVQLTYFFLMNEFCAFDVAKYCKSYTQTLFVKIKL